MDGPLSAPLEQKHARAATAPDKWRPERGYCRRPSNPSSAISNPSLSPNPLHATVPHRRSLSIVPVARRSAPEPPPNHRTPRTMIKQGGKRNWAANIPWRARHPDKLSIGCERPRRYRFVSSPVNPRPGEREKSHSERSCVRWMKGFRNFALEKLQGWI